MSLLMDALKKAEQAKQQGQSAGITPTPEPPPAAPEVTPPAIEVVAPPLPALPPKLELLDDEFLAHAQSPTPARTQGHATPPTTQKAPAAPPASAKPTAHGTTTMGHEAAQAAAHNVFAAKRPATSISKSFIITVGTSTLLAVTGIGIYFWLQLRPVGGVGAIAPLAAAPTNRPFLPMAPPSAPAVVPQPEKPAEPLAAATAQPATASEPRQPAPVAMPEIRQPSHAAAPESPIRITSSQLNKLNPALSQGFEAFGTGNLAAAKTAYEQVLRTEPRNSDALHGVAAIALREGKTELAESYYQRALDADPKDAVAQAGLMGIKGPSDPVASESRLKTLLAAQPELPALHFALGNVYSRQGRWSEAQQAYFQAYSGEPENADYAFNLAVSLDQLRQNKLAVQYYNQAMSLAASRPAGFDPAQVGVRLRELQQQP